MRKHDFLNLAVGTQFFQTDSRHALLSLVFSYVYTYIYICTYIVVIWVTFPFCCWFWKFNSCCCNEYEDMWNLFAKNTFVFVPQHFCFHLFSIFIFCTFLFTFFRKIQQRKFDSHPTSPTTSKHQQQYIEKLVAESCAAFGSQQTKEKRIVHGVAEVGCCAMAVRLGAQVGGSGVGGGVEANKVPAVVEFEFMLRFTICFLPFSLMHFSISITFFHFFDTPAPTTPRCWCWFIVQCFVYFCVTEKNCIFLTTITIFVCVCVFVYELACCSYQSPRYIHTYVPFHSMRVRELLRAVQIVVLILIAVAALVLLLGGC